MCALRIVVPSNSYTGGFVRYSPVVTDGLKLWMFPGGMGFPSTKNHATGGSDATILGSPIIQDGYAECTGGSDLFQTDVFGNQEMTVIAVMRSHKLESNGSEDTASAGGNLVTSGSVSGFRLGYQRDSEGGHDSTSFYLGVGSGEALGSVRIRDPDNTKPTSWSMAAATISNSGSTVFDLTSGKKRSNGSLTFFEPGTRPVTVGGNPDTLNGKCDVAFFAIYHRTLSEGEIDAIHEQVSKFLEVRAGIIV